MKRGKGLTVGLPLVGGIGFLPRSWITRGHHGIEGRVYPLDLPDVGFEHVPG